MHGLHLTADLYRCRCERTWLADAALLGPACLQAADAAGLPPLNQLFHAHDGQALLAGVAGAVLMADAQLLLRTWPAQQGVTLDLQVFNLDAETATQARRLMDALVALFAPEWTEQRSLDRGDGE